jgi:O-antigen ligase
VAIVAVFFEPPESALQRATNISTMESRLRTWTAVLEQSMKDLFTGIGLNNLRDFFFEEKNWRLLSTTHNCYLSMLIELGIIGLVSYLAIIGSIIKKGWGLYRHHTSARSEWFGVATISIMVAYQIPSLFANNLYLTGLSHIFVYAFVGGIAGVWAQDTSPLSIRSSHERQYKTTRLAPAAW